MFWFLVFSHLVADYPLQPEWIARKKSSVGVLGIHGSVHLVVMLALAGEARLLLWPYLVILALAHFWIDLGKITLFRYRPNWTIRPYFIDQSLHFTTIGLTAYAVELVVAPLISPSTTNFYLFASGYLLVTYVWYISERVLAYSNEPYRQEVIQQAWTRMISRALMMTVFIWSYQQIYFNVALVNLAFMLPYVYSKYSLRAFLIDIMAAMSVTTIILLFRYPM